LGVGAGCRLAQPACNSQSRRLARASWSNPMGFITSYMIGGLAAVVAWSMVAPVDAGLPGLPAAFRSSDATGGMGTSVNRAAKSDRLASAAARAGEKKPVTAIEVVGIHDAAIVYRDRDGRVLYRTDPLSNVTVIAKGLKLPDITVRQDAGSATTLVPVHVPDKSGELPKMPIGCEPAASPIASPDLSHLTGRCISQAHRPIAVAALN
jgi:hypothetical protein